MAKYEKNKGRLCTCGAKAACKGMCLSCYSKGKGTPRTKCQHLGCETLTYSGNAYCSKHKRTDRIRCASENCSFEAWKDGLCKQCFAFQERNRTGSSSDRSRLRSRARAAGVSVELIEALHKHQANKCAICSVEMERGVNTQYSECIDHCHTTGAGRGLLCRTCNHSLGLYENFQKGCGLVIEPYERYLTSPPAKQLT